MTKRGLVLGGGGTVGVAWEIALLAGLLEGGCDVRRADVVVGTSAGSIVGTWVAQGQDLAARMRDRGRAEGSAATPPAMRSDPAAVGELFRLWGSFDGMTPERSAQVGALARKAHTASQQEMLAGFTDDGSGWPDKPLLICATDCESGELRAFTRDAGVPINVARAASCSVPGLFPTIEIGGRWYTDGAVRSWTSADAVLPFGPDRVLIVAPAGIEGGPGVRGLAWRQLDREMLLLREGGIDVRLIEFDDAAKQTGQNLMDAEGARQSADAGYAHGVRIAKDTATWWNAP